LGAVSEPRANPANLAPPEGIGPLRRQRLSWARLYLVSDARPAGHDPEPLLRAAFAGGVGMVELREKELRGELLLRAGETFRRIADIYSAPFIVNDDPDLARELKADGVHLGQDDLPASVARARLGPDAIIGLSTHSPEQIEAAHSEPVDYIAVGPIWETPTKAGRPAVGLELIRHAAETATLPWFAIGGIDTENVTEVFAAGARRACVVRSVRDAADPGEAARRLIGVLDPTRTAEV
jgi:thiamine-phosphate pyrophosphorylase